ncbi:MAG: hypothetical protein AAGB31_01635 [Bdellovibrio sp.]
MKRKRSIILTSAGIMILGLALGVLKNSETPSSDKSESSGVSPEKILTSSPRDTEATLPASTPHAASSSPTPEETQPTIATRPFIYEKELQEFAHLREKVLPNPDEQRLRKELLHNSRVLRALQSLLVTAPGSEDGLQLQNTALDLLLEALRSGARAEAVAVLKAVVADSSIENSQLDTQARTELAGVKAEVLFYWSAADPTANSTIEAALPGPVSQKIWGNVQIQQKKNLAESRSLQAQR